MPSRNAFVAPPTSPRAALSREIMIQALTSWGSIAAASRKARSATGKFRKIMAVPAIASCISGKSALALSDRWYSEIPRRPARTVAGELRALMISRSTRTAAIRTDLRVSWRSGPTRSILTLGSAARCGSVAAARTVGSGSRLPSLSPSMKDSNFDLPRCGFAWLSLLLRVGSP